MVVRSSASRLVLKRVSLPCESEIPDAMLGDIGEVTIQHNCSEARACMYRPNGQRIGMCSQAILSCPPARVGRSAKRPSTETPSSTGGPKTETDDRLVPLTKQIKCSPGGKTKPVASQERGSRPMRSGNGLGGAIGPAPRDQLGHGCGPMRTTCTPSCLKLKSGANALEATPPRSDEHGAPPAAGADGLSSGDDAPMEEGQE